MTVQVSLKTNILEIKKNIFLVFHKLKTYNMYSKLLNLYGLSQVAHRTLAAFLSVKTQHKDEQMITAWIIMITERKNWKLCRLFEKSCFQ